MLKLAQARTYSGIGHQRDGLSLADGEDVALRMMTLLRQSCVRIGVAGSIRRRCERVHDVDIICIPADGPTLFNATSIEPLDDVLLRATRDGFLDAPMCNGPRLKRFPLRGYPRTCVEVFICSVEKWGVIFALRTGPWTFSRAIVTPRHKGGRLDDGYMVRDGRLWRWTTHGSERVRTLKERNYLAYAGGWVDPEDREKVGNVYDTDSKSREKR